MIVIFSRKPRNINEQTSWFNRNLEFPMAEQSKFDCKVRLNTERD